MSKISVPNNITYIPVFLTLRCQLNCSYCINGRSNNLVKSRVELPSKDWLSFLNNLDIPKNVPITLGGGEPTLYKEFYPLLKELKHPIDLLTNLQFDLGDFIENISPESMFSHDITGYKSIRISFHPKFMNIEDTVLGASVLQNVGFNVGIFSINFPHNIEYNLKLAEECRISKVYFFIKDYLGYYDGHLFGHFKYLDSIKGKQNIEVSCKTNELIIGPEGNIYKCHRDLYLNEDPIGSIFDNNFKISSDYRDCNNYGECNPCDVKLKTNRFLEMGSCSVDILKKRWEREVDQITGWDQ
jgi:radical SAM protein with 4Fe4S-binding SPASM domain